MTIEVIRIGRLFALRVMTDSSSTTPMNATSVSSSGSRCDSAFAFAAPPNVIASGRQLALYDGGFRACRERARVAACSAVESLGGRGKRRPRSFSPARAPFRARRCTARARRRLERFTECRFNALFAAVLRF